MLWQDCAATSQSLTVQSAEALASTLRKCAFQLRLSTASRWLPSRRRTFLLTYPQRQTNTSFVFE